MFWAADGQDGNRLKLKKNWANFSSLLPRVLETLGKTQIMVDSLFKISLVISLLVSFKHLKYGRGNYSLNLGLLCPQILHNITPLILCEACNFRVCSRSDVAYFLIKTFKSFDKCMSQILAKNDVYKWIYGRVYVR